MPNILASKNVLIVPLTLFIKYNEKNSAEKFATLFKNMADDLLSNTDEKAKLKYFEKQQQFNEKSIQKILSSRLVTDFKLGKKNKTEFIAKLVSLLRLSSHNSIEVERAWNSLIEFDTESSNAFDALINLIHQGKSIYFIGDTNELHAKKILDLFSYFPFKNISFLENLPDPTPALPFIISHVTRSELSADNLASPVGKVYFCLSYAYKILLEQPCFMSLFFPSRQTQGLLTNLKKYLKDIGKTKDDILLVSPYQEQSSIIQTLALEAVSKENFYSSLLEMPCTAAMLTQSHVAVQPTPPLAVPDEDLPVSEESSLNLSAGPSTC